MVTQPSHLETFADAVDCFVAQTHSDRELIVVHDGGDSFDDALRHTVASRAPGEEVSVISSSVASLGSLRNAAVERAEGDLVCQWDDDDLFHPDRLASQIARLERQSATACFLTEQLHLFEATGELFYDDWTTERFPYCFIQGTLLARRDATPTYPDQALGEDTALLETLIRDGARITGLQDHGELVIYRYTGSNSWDEVHHRKIAAWKHQRRELLVDRLPSMHQRLAEFPVAARTVQLDLGHPVSITLGR